MFQKENNAADPVNSKPGDSEESRRIVGNHDLDLNEIRWEACFSGGVGPQRDPEGTMGSSPFPRGRKAGETE